MYQQNINKICTKKNGGKRNKVRYYQGCIIKELAKLVRHFPGITQSKIVVFTECIIRTYTCHLYFDDPLGFSFA